MALSANQEAILVWMLRNESVEGYSSWPPSHIAAGIGKQPVHGGRGQGGRGKGHRVFNPAHRIISSLTGLRKRGLVTWGQRHDGYSGTAYRLTEEGRDAATALAD